VIRNGHEPGGHREPKGERGKPDGERKHRVLEEEGPNGLHPPMLVVGAGPVILHKRLFSPVFQHKPPISGAGPGRLTRSRASEDGDSH
jgi:hypothetical protein